MKLTRPVSWFLVAFGVWSWVIWITFIKNLFKDGSGLAFDDAGDPTAYLWVHLTLAVVSFVLGTVVGGIGLRGVRALRQMASDQALSDQALSDQESSDQESSDQASSHQTSS
ncbi:hypothetical protein [Streptomyces sp. NPDC093544]|uniref:SCO4848 family membrane protein n=1 Tax=Streptomyces sp. NPDC093544 TaxID=3155200 RepID=UPI003415DDB4